MSAPGDDRDLHGLFEALRDEDAKSAPAFGPLFEDARRRQAPRPRAVRAFAWAAGVAGVALAAVLVFRPVSHELSDEDALAMARALSSWSASTDTLASLSGVQIPGTVPGLELTSIALPEEAAADAAASPDPTVQQRRNP